MKITQISSKYAKIASIKYAKIASTKYAKIASAVIQCSHTVGIL
jgi:hypothetical protein